MKRYFGIACLALAALGVASEPADARGRHSGGARSGAHRHHAHAHAAFRFGYPIWPAFRSPIYGPLPPGYGFLVPREDAPVVYVEQFTGTPTQHTEGEIYCPERGAHFPQATDCPGGWQRVFRPQGAPTP